MDLLEEFEENEKTLVLIDLINSFIHVASRLVSKVGNFSSFFNFLKKASFNHFEKKKFTIWQNIAKKRKYF